MKNLVKLFSILQLTKEQPLTGYLLAGIKLTEAETLAEHHYGACIMAFFLLQKVKKAGGQIDDKKIMNMLLIHDLGELFGGDISAALHRKYPELREHKNKIGEKAMELLGCYLDKESGDDLKKLFLEFEDGDSDEAKVARIFDQMDHQFFMEHYNLEHLNPTCKIDYRDKFVSKYISNSWQEIKDEQTKKIMEEFLNKYNELIHNAGFRSYILMDDLGIANDV